MEHRFEDRWFVHRQRQRLPHLDVIQRFFLSIERQETDIQTGLLHDLDIGILTHACQIRRVRKRHDLALIFLQLGITHRRIRGN
ncbi:hypothetical protein D3C87_1480610 [compost metagenome]